MVEERDKMVEAALDRLARDVNTAAPRPGPEITGRVLEDAGDVLADRAMAALAAEVQAATPRPGADLMARVLADAAAVAPLATAQGVELAPARPRTLGDILFGWTGGAVAALSLCMTMGVAIGMELPADQMPMMGEEKIELAEADPMDFLPEDFI